MNPTLLAACITGVVALVVALMGVYQEQIRRSWLGPELEVWFDRTSLVDSHLTHFATPRVVDGKTREFKIPVFWVRLRVANVGQSAARAVELIATELWRREPGRKDWTRDPKFSPLGLKWSYIGKSTLDLLAAGVEKHCDLLQIPDPSRSFVLPGAVLSPPPETQAILELEVHPNANPGVLGPGDYKLVMVAVASDARPVRRTVSFTVPGQWTDDEREMQERVKVGGLLARGPLMSEPLS